MPKSNIKWILFLISFWGIAFLSAFGLYNFVRDFTVCWRLTSLVGIPSPGCTTQTIDPLETPVIVSRQSTATPNPTTEPFLLSEDVTYP